MPFEDFKCDDPRIVARWLRDLAAAIEAGYVEYHSHDIAGGHPTQPNLVELTLYLRSDKFNDPRSE